MPFNNDSDSNPSNNNGLNSASNIHLVMEVAPLILIFAIVITVLLITRLTSKKPASPTGNPYQVLSESEDPPPPSEEDDLMQTAARALSMSDAPPPLVNRTDTVPPNEPEETGLELIPLNDGRNNRCS